MARSYEHTDCPDCGRRVVWGLDGRIWRHKTPAGEWCPCTGKSRPAKLLRFELTLDDLQRALGAWVLLRQDLADGDITMRFHPALGYPLAALDAEGKPVAIATVEGPSDV